MPLKFLCLVVLELYSLLVYYQKLSEVITPFITNFFTFWKMAILGWSPDVVKGTGDKFVKAVNDTLWALDPHHNQFHDRACALPSIFSEFQGFNDWQRKKQKKPQFSQRILEKHIGVLSDYLMQPWYI